MPLKRRKDKAAQNQNSKFKIQNQNLAYVVLWRIFRDELRHDVIMDWQKADWKCLVWFRKIIETRSLQLLSMTETTLDDKSRLP